MDAETFKTTFHITKHNGEYVDPEYVRTRVMAAIRKDYFGGKLDLETRRALVADLLDAEGDFLRQRTGYVVAAIARDAAEKASDLYLNLDRETKDVFGLPRTF